VGAVVGVAGGAGAEIGRTRTDRPRKTVRATMARVLPAGFPQVVALSGVSVPLLWLSGICVLGRPKSR
jgi:hypothetical protein